MTVPKTDYFDDPNAPQANSLVVAVSAAVLDDQGRILLIERSDNGYWALPGGAQDLGESTSQALVREVREETNVDVEIVGISGIYSDPRHVIAYDDGEVRQEFSICFRARPVGGTPQSSPESRKVGWFDRFQVSELSIQPSTRLRIDHGLSGRSGPYIT